MKKTILLVLIFLFASFNIFAINSKDYNKDNNISIYGNDFTVQKDMIYNNIAVFGGNLLVKGTVENNITVFGGDLTVAKSAKINGSVNVFGGELIVQPGAAAPTNFNNTTLPNELNKLIVSPHLLLSGLTAYDLIKINFNITRHLVFLILGFICIWFFENKVISMIRGIEHYPLRTLGYGMLSWILLIPILVILIISVIGIIFVPFLILYYILACIFGWTAIACIIGEKCSEKWISNKKHLLTFLIGLVILVILSLIPILSLLIAIIGAIFALGTVLMTKFGQRNMVV